MLGVASLAVCHALTRTSLAAHTDSKWGLCIRTVVHLLMKARLAGGKVSCVNTVHDLWCLQALWQKRGLQFSSGSHPSSPFPSCPPDVPPGGIGVCLWLRLLRVMPQGGECVFQALQVPNM